VGIRAVVRVTGTVPSFLFSVRCEEFGETCLQVDETVVVDEQRGLRETEVRATSSTSC